MSDLIKSGEESRSSDCPPCPGGPVLEHIQAREAKIGRDFIVRRTIPSKSRRMIGAWCFLDHAGPVDHGLDDGLRVGPHPHIGLQTFTWMIEGEVLHRDSLGYEQLIVPGQVNLMTAGRGIVHSEESPTNTAGRLHAAQLWIALPEAERHREPSFHHYPQLPAIERDGFTITVLAGEALGHIAPAEVYSPLVGLDLSAPSATMTRLPLNAAYEYGAVCLRGSAQVAGETVVPGMLLYLGQHRDSIEIACQQATQLLLVGGVPFAEEILVWWNFVARTPEEIAIAASSWNAGGVFGEVAGTQLPPLKAPDPAGLRLTSQRAP